LLGPAVLTLGRIRGGVEGRSCVCVCVCVCVCARGEVRGGVN
jgi:hypothetical protein